MSKHNAFPPLQINLGLRKHFFKALEKDGDCLGYICSLFPALSAKKLKTEVSGGP